MPMHPRRRTAGRGVGGEPHSRRRKGSPRTSARGSVPLVHRPLPVAVLLALVLALAPPVRADPELVPLPPQPPDVPWPTRAWPVGAPGPEVDRAALERAQDDLFAARGPGGLPDTRALLVVHRGRLVASRYAPGFDASSRFESWSMAKTVTQALVGILVRQGRLSLDQAPGIAAWQRDGDPRRAITLRHLLQMTTGLDNADGDEVGLGFGVRMLFGDLSRDVVAAAAEVPLLHEPGTHWAYSTGTSMLLADVVTRKVGGKEALLAFVESELAAPLGITTLVPEFDAAGNFLGGSSVWAGAEDWARLGLLYLRGGRWDGRAILADGWVDFSRSPAHAEDNAKHGAHLWLNREPAGTQFPRMGGPELESMFFLAGAFGQYVAMSPDRDLVIVRLGEMQATDWDPLGDAIARIAGAFPAAGEAAP